MKMVIYVCMQIEIVMYTSVSIKFAICVCSITISSIETDVSIFRGKVYSPLLTGC